MENQIVVFNDQEILCLKTPDGTIWIAVKTLCQAIGLDADWAVRALKKHPVLGSTQCVHNVLDASGRMFPMVCLPLHLVNGWLFSIEIGKVKEEARPILITYQRECYQVLFDHFFSKQKNMITNVKRFRQIADAERVVKEQMAELRIKLSKLHAERNRITQSDFNQLDLFEEMEYETLAVSLH